MTLPYPIRTIGAKRRLLILVLLGLLIFGMVAYGFQTGDRLVTLDTPLVNTIGRIKLEAITTVIMIEGSIAKGIVPGMEDNWTPLDRALDDLHYLAMAQDGWQEVIFPFRNPGIESGIQALKHKREEWQQETNRRLREGEYSNLPDPLGVRYREVYFEFIDIANGLDKHLQEVLAANLVRFRITQAVLLFLCILMTVSAGIVLHRLERQRFLYMQDLLRSGQQLAKEIEERKRTAMALEAQRLALERSNRDLQQFAYVASHDLQEPLRMIGSYVKLLERRYKGRLDSDADEFIHFAVDGAARMRKMIQDLLSYSRVETAGQIADRTDATTIVKQVIANLHQVVEKNAARITHEGLPPVVVDATHLSQLFQNLISNAIKFRRANPPEICITAQSEEDFVRFAVRDNGIGIDNEYTERIFAIFQRLHTSSEYPGTGIGLAICKRIVERYGGKIWVESQPGVGSTFYFTLPAHIPPGEV